MYAAVQNAGTVIVSGRAGIVQRWRQRRLVRVQRCVA
jgi:hypothetical protein